MNKLNEFMDLYADFAQKNEKLINYTKNTIFSTPAYVAGGFAGTFIASVLTDSPEIRAFGYIAGQEAVGTAVFWPLHVKDNPDLYFEENTGKFKWKEFASDFVKQNFGLTAVSGLFMIGKPLLNWYLQKQGYDPMSATFVTELAGTLAYWAAAPVTAKLLGIIRNNKKVELQSNSTGVVNKVPYFINQDNVIKTPNDYLEELS